MKMNNWNKRYLENKTGWDIGNISTPIKEYVDQLKDKNLKILIPGSGNSYEAEYLHKNGFKNVYVIDIAEKALQNFSDRVPDFPKEHLILQDFFKLDDQFDLILEQTFYCAISPELRDEYVKKVFELLKPNGKLVGVLFQFPLTEVGPPFGGSKEEYLKRFSPFFTIEILEDCNNSIPSRKEKEVFVKFTKKAE
ncbi:MAG TPA: methyltransferase domain-containing protein [Flavobacteriia bacterium]|nr:methyltransferase domain-containing protein [Flavobacteriia bacterium]